MKSTLSEVVYDVKEELPHRDIGIIGMPQFVAEIQYIAGTMIYGLIIRQIIEDLNINTMGSFFIEGEE